MTDNVEHETPGRYEPPGRENHTKQRKSEKSMSFCAGKSYQTEKKVKKYELPRREKHTKQGKK